jgi:hypothetical protein
MKFDVNPAVYSAVSVSSGASLIHNMFMICDKLSFINSSGEEIEQDDNDPEAPVLTRRKRYLKRSDRAVKSLETANCDPTSPVMLHTR